MTEKPDCLTCSDKGFIKRKYGTVSSGSAKFVKRYACPDCSDSETCDLK